MKEGLKVLFAQFLPGQWALFTCPGLCSSTPATLMTSGRCEPKGTRECAYLEENSKALPHKGQWTLFKNLIVEEQGGWFHIPLLLGLYRR